MAGRRRRAGCWRCRLSSRASPISPRGPPSADQLYAASSRLPTAARPASWPPSRPNLTRFLAAYPADPRAAEMRGYQDDLERIACSGGSSCRPARPAASRGCADRAGLSGGGAAFERAIRKRLSPGSRRWSPSSAARPMPARTRCSSAPASAMPGPGRASKSSDCGDGREDERRAARRFAGSSSGPTSWPRPTAPPPSKSGRESLRSTREVLGEGAGRRKRRRSWRSTRSTGRLATMTRSDTMRVRQYCR